MSNYGTTWNTAAQNAADGLFFVKRDLVLALRAIENKNFSYVESRQQAFEIWDKVMPSHPVAYDKEFSPYTTYIAVELCEFSKLEAQMLKALSFKESSKHRNEPKETPKSTTNVRVNQEHDHISGVLVNFSPMDDSMSAFYESVRGLKDLAGMASCTYDKTSFEKKFGLKWGG